MTHAQPQPSLFSHWYLSALKSVDARSYQLERYVGSCQSSIRVALNARVFELVHTRCAMRCPCVTINTCCVVTCDAASIDVCKKTARASSVNSKSNLQACSQQLCVESLCSSSVLRCRNACRIRCGLGLRTRFTNHRCPRRLRMSVGWRTS